MMKKFLTAFCMMLLSLPAICQLSAEEKSKVTEHLNTTLQLLQKSVEGMTPQQLNARPDSGQWSVADCVFHLALSETNIWDWMTGVLAQKVEQQEASSAPKVSDEALMDAVEDRSHKVKANETLQPVKASEKWKTPAEALAFIAAERAKHIAFINDSKEDFRSHTTQGPIGTMDAYQVILLLSQHTVRHVKQIEEVKLAVLGSDKDKKAAKGK